MPTDTATIGLIIHPDGAHLGIYLESLAKVKEVAGVYLADPTGETVEQAKTVLKDKFRGSFRDTRTMLREAAPLLAVVSVEAALAPPEIDAALDAGCHVFTEKPACVRAEDFAPLVRKADSKHRLLMLALANRLNPPVQEARRLVRTGALGKIYGVEMHLIADQTRLKQAAYQASWFAHKQRAGGGHLIWLGIHWLDLAMYISGSAIQEVACLINNAGGQPVDIEDSATLAMRLDNGALGTMTSAYYLDKGYHSHIKIWGEQGWLELGDLEQAPLRYAIFGRDSKIEQFEYAPGQGGYETYLRAAVRAAIGLGDPPISNADGLRVLETIFACYHSAETGRKITVGGKN